MLKKFCPVSNLPFISKVLKKVVARRLDLYLSANSLHGDKQSASRENHGTESALMKVQNDLLEALDKGSSCVLALRDLSVAFDMIDHDILRQQLQHYGHCTGMVEVVSGT